MQQYADIYLLQSFSTCWDRGSTVVKVLCDMYRGTAVAQWLRCCATDV